jgi:hypothetical protein
MNQQTPSDPAAFRKSYAIIFWAFVVAVPNYWLVLHFALQDNPKEPTTIMLIPFYVISVISAFAGFLFRNRIQNINLDNATFTQAVQRIAPRLIFVLSCFEVIALCGFIPAILSGRESIYFTFAVPAVVLLILQFPLLGEIAGKLEKVHRRSSTSGSNGA